MQIYPGQVTLGGNRRAMHVFAMRFVGNTSLQFGKEVQI